MSFRHRTVPVFFAVSAEFRLIDLVRAQSGVTLFSFIYISVSAEDVGIKACEARGAKNAMKIQRPRDPIKAGRRFIYGLSKTTGFGSRQQILDLTSIFIGDNPQSRMQSRAF